MLTSRFQNRLESPLSCASDGAWSRFVTALEVQPSNSISESGGLGAYDIRPRRLCELKLATGLRPIRNGKRQAYECEFVKPWTKERFLADPLAQYKVLKHSIVLYDKALESGEIDKPKDMSKSGALSILAVGGIGALKAWPNLFSNTRARFEAAHEAF